jgi:hypothetical protein
VQAIPVTCISYVQWLKKLRDEIEGSNFGYEYHLINTSHDVTEPRNKQVIRQIRPLLRHNEVAAYMYFTIITFFQIL